MAIISKATANAMQIDAASNMIVRASKCSAQRLAASFLQLDGTSLVVEKKLPAAENSSQRHFLPIPNNMTPLKRSIIFTRVKTYKTDKLWQRSCDTRDRCLILNTHRALWQVYC
ncbi:MAG: hypothetical protein ACRD5K_07065 [Candidatus Acidiferrales bacterium]